MATKNYLDLTGLQKYHELISQYIDTEDTKSIKSLTRVGNTVNFFKTADASGTAAYTVDIPDVSGFMDKIASATGSKVVASTASGQVSESDIAIADVATKSYADTAAQDAADGKDAAIAAAKKAGDDAQADVDALETLVGSIPQSAEATSVVGYAAEVADAAEDAANDYTDTQISAVEAKLAGALHYKGVVATVSALPATAENGDVYHVTEASAEYAYFTDGNTGDWEELGSEIDLSDYSTTTQMNAAIATAKGEAITTASNDATSKANAAEQNAKDYADGLAVNYDAAGSAATAKSEAIAAAAADATTKANTAEQNAKDYADDLVDAIDTGVMSVVEGSSNGTISVDGSDVNVHGLGSAAYQNTSAFDASGAAATAKSEVIGTSGDAASASTIYGAKAYADAATEGIATADIEALFE